jgi:hypothetical protein
MMARLGELSIKVEQLDGLRDTNDLNDWEQRFVTSVVTSWLHNNKNTQHLTDKQVEKIEQLWEKHFA